MKRVLVVVGSSEKAKEIAQNLKKTINGDVEIVQSGWLALFKIQVIKYDMIFVSQNLSAMTGNTILNSIKFNKSSKNICTPAKLIAA